MADPLLRVDGLRKHLGGEAILRGVSLELDRGEVVAVMGENGAGKSVLFCAIAGGLGIDAGTVRVDGSVAPSTRGLGVHLAQSGMAIDLLTGRENAAFYAGLDGADRTSWAGYADAFGLTPDLDRRVRDYSGGMRRKLELAMALGVEAPLYLLDEPTAGLDLSVIGTVHDALVDRRRAGAGVLLSSHVPLDMEVADAVAFLTDGSLSKPEPPERLLDDLPSVVRIRGGIGGIDPGVRESFVDGAVFARGDEARGFLAPGASVARLERSVAALAGPTYVSEEPPTYTDLFNYRTRIDPLETP